MAVAKKAIHKPDTWYTHLPHPLTDARFAEEFCAHIHATSTDQSIKTVRERAYKFIKMHMAQQLQQELADYRVWDFGANKAAEPGGKATTAPEETPKDA